MNAPYKGAEHEKMYLGIARGDSGKDVRNMKIPQLLRGWAAAR